ncbi:TPA: SIR2 family protein [Yersinia enterocolitica]
MINWPEPLILDLARRRCILFLGAGVSMNSVSATGVSPPSWKSFLEKCIADLQSCQQIKKLITNEDYLTACELIKKKLPRGQFDTIVQTQFLTPAYTAADIHKNLFRLDCRIVITPNFDKIYETYVNTETHGTVTIKNYYDDDIVSSIKNNGRVILKIHGTVDNTRNLIFSRSDYAKARSKSRDFYELLNALGLTHTFLFIGCGVNDPDIKLLLEDSFFKHNATKPHYMIAANSSIHKDMIPVIEETLNLNLIQYKSTRGNHDILTQSLNELSTLVETKRLEIKETMNW